MSVEYAKPGLPSEDVRWRIVQGTMRRHGFSSNALIETLHTVQQAFGYLDDVALKYVALSLRVPLSKVYGVATFYHLFTLKPQGKHGCVVCTGTACYILGAPQLIDAINRRYGINPGETTADGEVSLMTARCLGACSIAPATVMDGEILGKMSPEATLQRIEKWVNHDA